MIYCFYINIFICLWAITMLVNNFEIIWNFHRIESPERLYVALKNLIYFSLILMSSILTIIISIVQISKG